MEAGRTESIAKPDPLTGLEQLAEAYNHQVAVLSGILSLILGNPEPQSGVASISGHSRGEEFGGYEKYVAAVMLQWLRPL